MPPRPPSGFDEIQDRRKERRTITGMHLQTLMMAAHTFVRSCEYVLYRCAANDDVSHSTIQISGMPHVYQQAALRTETRTRDGAARFGQEVQLDKIAEKLSIDPADCGCGSRNLRIR